MSLLSASSLAAQSATVPASSEAYDRIEAISAFFPTRGVFLGERGVSARQLATYLHRLRAVVEAAPPSARRVWAAREIEYVLSAGLAAVAFDSGRAKRPLLRGAWRADLSGSDARNERITPNGLGQIDAVTNPFETGRQGWRLEKGAVGSFTPTGALTHRRYAAAIEPRFASFVSEGRKERIWQGTLQRAYVRGALRNAAISLGADELLWGQSAIGALFLSGNAAPFPAITLSTDTAIMLPWLFRFAGPVRGTLIVADLGPRQDPPHAKLAAWQVSIAPWSRFELGVTVMTQTGGSGGPPATFFKRVVDLFPVIDALAPQHADLQFSNKLAGGNLRLRVPELSGLDLYYELAIDDFDGRRLRSSLTDDAAHLLGVRLPFITPKGLFAVRAEWHNTALRIYEHTQFRSGITYKSHILGSPLGPHAAAGYLSTSWQPSPRSAMDLTFADERRDPAIYATTIGGDRDRGFQFVRVTDDPDVRRARVTLGIDRAIPSGALRFALGHNRSWRPGQAKRREWMGQMTLRSVHLPTF